MLLQEYHIKVQLYQPLKAKSINLTCCQQDQLIYLHANILHQNSDGQTFVTLVHI